MSALDSIDMSLLPGLGRKILLVDDEPAQLKLAKIQLESAGFVVDTAQGGRAARELLATAERPAAIVTDVVMDDLDGFALCRLLRRDPKFAMIPIVLMSSAFDEAADKALARNLGASALVTRSSDQQACVEALVKSLAEGPPTSVVPPADMPDLYAHRLVHQLARVSGRKVAAEVRYETLFANANDAISILTSDGFVIDMNHRWEEIRGLPREELRGRHIRDFAAPGHEQINDEEYAGLVEAGTGKSAPVAIRGRDGSTLYFEFTTAVVDVDGVPTIFSVGRDVTALLEAQRRLVASERHYRSLVENVPDVIWSATTDWKYTFLSPNVEKLSGYTAEEILEGKHGASLARVHPDDVARVRSAREATSTRGVPFDLECRYQHRDGHWMWVHFRGVPTKTGIDGIYTDITARKELEEQLCQAQKLEAVGQLTAGVAHDFNNILTVIQANGAFLVDSLTSDETACMAAQDVCDAARRGVEVTKQLLAFSRREPAQPLALDLNALLTGVERMLLRSAGSGVAVTIARGEPLAMVHADGGQVEQVILNLVINARDAMNGRGTLVISTENVDLEGPYVRLSVKDDGCGMDAEMRRKIFQPFFTTKPRGSGTGLGLSTCYGIVRNAGGHISVESEPGRGTTFHVYLPRIGSNCSS